MNKFSILFSAVMLVAGTSAALAEAPTDAQIASIVVTANQVDIDAGKFAEGKAQAADVKAFAKQMVTDHTGVNQQAAALASKLKLTPQDNPTSQALKQGGVDSMKKLETLQGAAFDKAYIEREIDYHAQVIDAIDKTLIPSAQNAELKDLLVKYRPAFVGHMEHAKQIQTRLAK